ncbi:ATP-dependent RNA helicase TDRD9 [Brachionus plicatilis]|uniref:ATP-dependent RNA helicase TDRD9 n=1 Tax=Brachionus plicatilis TaxID=10195 RepID=A0A3M7Q3Z7_BRAPC|nr:ATP-dependent RNA helicase TDRD9 [Brachionus plicatilis]
MIIIYVDYGNSEEKDFRLIYECPQELIKIPSQAIRCEIAHLRLDSLILSDKVKSEKALDEYSTILYSVQNLKARIYSIVENTVRVTLLDSDNPLFEYDLASKLIKIGIFDKCDEPYASKNNLSTLKKNIFIFFGRKISLQKLKRLLVIQTLFLFLVQKQKGPLSNLYENSQYFELDYLYFINKTKKLKHEERISTRFYEGVECSKSSKEWVHIENIENNISSLRFDKNEKFVFKIRSPIETRLYTMTKEPYHMSARPDRLSINRILLDQDHTLKCSNLLVAHQISENGRDIVLRETCLLPKIKGLVSLVLLAFSPEVEFRYDPKTLTYTGALCGLGFDTETRRPIYTENDIEDYFEVDFYDRDIALLNSFRSIVNQLLVGNKNSKKFTGDDDANKVRNLQKNSRTSILALLSEKRTLKEPQFFDRRFRWKQINEKHLKILSDTDKIILKSREKNLTFLMPLRAVDFAKIKQEKRYFNQQLNMKKISNINQQGSLMIRRNEKSFVLTTKIKYSNIEINDFFSSNFIILQDQTTDFNLGFLFF